MGCSSKSEFISPPMQSSSQKIHKILSDFVSYKSEASIEYISNKSSNIYEVVQYSRITGEYRIEVIAPEESAGSITLSDGKTIYQYNNKVSSKVTVGNVEKRERSEIFVTSFIKNYFADKEVTVSTGKFDANNFTMLEADVEGEHPYINSQKLWIDNKSFKPIKMVIYDSDGVEKVIVTFKTFEYNITLEDKLFTVN
jgi:outer membrane lipoprotein-sorting protein